MSLSVTGAYAPGWPGIDPRRTSSAKSGVGKSLSAASHVWFTLRHGIQNEIDYPRLDSPCRRDPGLDITDGREFSPEEQRHARSQLSHPFEGVPLYGLANTCSAGRYRIEREILADPARDALLQRARFVPLQGGLAAYRRHVRVAPHLEEADGHWPQDLWLDGTPYWNGIRMDERQVGVDGYYVRIAAPEARTVASPTQDPVPIQNRPPGGSAALTEQSRDAPEIARKELFPGRPSGSAMPLVRRTPSMSSRCARGARNAYSTCRRRPPSATPRRKRPLPVPAGASTTRLARSVTGCIPRIQMRAQATVRWSGDGWRTVHDTATRDTGLGVHTADLPRDR